MNSVMQYYDTFGVFRALEEINDFTKGYKVSNFITKGRYWYGITQKEYDMRRSEIEEKLNNPDRVQYSITGTGNTR